MKNQLTYLNVVLTIIAVALTALVLQNADIIPKAHAAGMPYATLPLNERGEVPVTIMSGDMDVRVTNTVSTKVVEPISIKSDFYSTLSVNIDKVGGHSVSDVIPVKMKQ